MCIIASMNAHSMHQTQSLISLGVEFVHLSSEVGFLGCGDHSTSVCAELRSLSRVHPLTIDEVHHG